MADQLIIPDDEIRRQREAIEFDGLVAEMRDILDRNTNPWTTTNKFDGSNWLVASFGQDPENQNWYLTTDHVNGSMLDGDAESDARFCALARRLMPMLLAERERSK